MAITNKRGIFALLDVRERQASGNWPVKSDVWLTSPAGNLTNFATGAVATPNTGYFGGGPLSTVDRIDYTNDTATASPKGPLSVGRGYLAATGNSSFGYFGGGAGPSSRVDRIDYANDTATASPKGPLTVARIAPAATSAAANGLPQ